MKDNNLDNIIMFLLFTLFILIVLLIGIQIGKWDERQRIKIQYQIGEKP